MKIYIAGPMTGIADFNRAAFDEATERFRSNGWEVVSPVELNISKYGSWEATHEVAYEKIIADDLREVAKCDAITLLPGWEKSVGVQREVAAAIEHDLFLVDPWGNDKFPIRGITLDFDIPVQSHEFGRKVHPLGGVKDNVGKPRIELIPVRPLFEIAKVLADGAVTYGEHNWRKGFAWADTYGSVQRHLMWWLSGQDLDPKTGISHLAHASSQLMFLLEMSLAGTGEDDRYKPEENK